ncbi:hypothetical protein [Nocardioides sp. cx-173]|uniref:hypothetical protein n=1 Tax=Nocardioides sp. cx-173 TaxID=2898796 RepID=UPI001E3DE8C0|nr:hypothetical protein [Nocardioides sp. cx-173]MCD4526891.1 hypothetical protein [Nocardioides sp. cx-173]UGB41320.1 hypothetical protein LQ940_18360 [Nocardioides sp. cx-173]
MSATVGFAGDYLDLLLEASFRPGPQTPAAGEDRAAGEAFPPVLLRGLAEVLGR